MCKSVPRGKFITGFSGHNRADDTPCLIPHLEQVRKNTGGLLRKKIVADAAYGSEENYAYLEQHGVENFLKYNTFYQDTHHYRNPQVLHAHQFRAEHLAYDPETDTFVLRTSACPSSTLRATPPTTATRARATPINALIAAIACCEANAPKPRGTVGSTSPSACWNTAGKPDQT